MPSSFVSRSSTTLLSIFVSFSTSAYAAAVPNYVSHPYNPVKTYQGQDFFNDFNFFNDADPTHGFVTYVDQATARANNLARVDGNAFVMSVDSTNTYDSSKPYYNINGVGRPSVRIEGKQSFTKGLWVADIGHMPASVCGTWPACKYRIDFAIESR